MWVGGWLVELTSLLEGSFLEVADQNDNVGAITTSYGSQAAWLHCCTRGHRWCGQGDLVELTSVLEGSFLAGCELI